MDRSTRWSLIHLAVTLAALSAVAETLIAAGPLGSIYVAYLFPAAGALYVATGLLAWARRPANRLGSLMTACGTVMIVSSYGNTEVPALIAVGAITSTLPLSVLVHLVHASPSGAVIGRAARVTVLAGYLVGLILQVPVWAFTPQPPPFDVLLVSPRPDLARLGGDVQKWVGLLVLLATVWLLGRRLRAYEAAERRILAALAGFALLAVLAVAVGADVLPSFGLGPVGTADVQLAAVALVPLGFLLVVLRGGFTPPAELAAFAGPIMSAVGSPDAGRQLERAVGAALGDPSAIVLRWLDGEYRDVEGRPVDAAPGPYRSLARIDGADTPLGAVVHDTALDTDPMTLAAVTHVAGIALERDQLARAVAASRLELQEASQRVLVAADAERRRITRDLHDGLQGALVLLSLHARELVEDAADEDARKAAASLADGVDAAAATLRDIVDGVLPSPLVERGIGAAVLDLAEDLPMAAAVSVSPPELSLPTPVESTAYFVIAEAVTNVIKHARATRIEITIALDDGVLSLEVLDDGVGAVSYTGGSGLAGLRDRLVILGGTVEATRLEVGTRVRAWLPCG